MLFELETGILMWIQENLRCAFLNPIVTFITHLGDTGVFWIVLTILLLCIKKTRRLGAFCAAAMILNFLVVNVALKPLIARTRPYDLLDTLKTLVPAEHDFSFPSGHSAISLSCAWVIFRMTPKKWGVPALVLALLISLSRLYVGVHYPTDVIAGVVIGALMAEIAMFALKKVPARKKG